METHIDSVDNSNTLNSLYENDIDNIEKIQEFVQNKKVALQVLQEYSELLKEEKPEKNRIVFYTHVVSRITSKTKAYKNFVQAISTYLEKIISKYRESLMSIKLLEIILDSCDDNIYLPVSHYILVLIRNALKAKGVNNFKRDYKDLVRTTSDDEKNVELQLYVISVSMKLLKRDLSKYSIHMSFPEFIEPFIAAMKAIPSYKDFLEDSNIVKACEERSKEILKIRKAENNTVADLNDKIRKRLGFLFKQ